MMNRKRPTDSRFTLRVMLLASSAILAIASVQIANANPLSPTASDPGVSYTGLGTSNTNIGLDQSRTIINWGSFNISSGETTRFIFGGNNWIVLNRVTQGSASINGNLYGCLDPSCGSYGGNIWVYAADGVLIGPNARVNAGGFLATTSPLATSDSDFLAGTEPVADQFDFGASVGGASIAVASGAQINAANGSVALVAPQVTTGPGSSVSASGAVLYGAAQSYRIKFAQDSSDDLDLVDFEVPAGRAGGTDSSTPISVGGNTTAGKVFIASVSKADVANAIIDVSGSVSAASASKDGGDIVLSGDGDVNVGGQLSGANVSVSSSGGTLTVSGSVTAQQASGAGGNITVTAPTVVLAGSSRLDATGTTGGTILVGGDVHGGANPTQNFSPIPIATANSTTVANGASIKANGTAGAGGKAVVWSNASTNFAGSISATGNGGDGGFVETSGGSLNIGQTASVDTSAVGGATGTWLLDPSGDFVIATSGGNETPTQVVTGLASNNVVIVANNDITVSNAIDATPNVSATHNLIFEAGESIDINANITLNGGSFVATANDYTDIGTTDAQRGASPGTFTMASGTTIDTSKSSGSVTIAVETPSQANGSGGGGTFAPGGATLYGINTGGGTLAISGATSVALDGAINAGAGTVDLGDASVGSITEGAGGSITAGTLTGISTGTTNLNSASNAIGTLGTFTNTSSDFTLDDSVALTITGTLNVTGHTLTLNDSGGGIGASGAVVEASTLTGASMGTANFSNASNSIGAVGNFNTNNGDFTLDDGNVSIPGALNAGSGTVDLVSTGGINEFGGTGSVIAGTLKGSSVGGAFFDGSGNSITTLGDFTNATSSNFVLKDAHALTVSGTLDNQVGYTKLTTTGAGSNLVISGTIKANGQTLTTISSGTIDESAGKITAATLTGSSVGGAAFTGTNFIGGLGSFTNTGSGDFALTDAQALTVSGILDNSGVAANVSLTTTGANSDLTVTGTIKTNTSWVLSLISSGKIDESAGAMTAGALTGSSVGGATFTGTNQIASLYGFTNSGSGGFAFTDAHSLVVAPHGTGTIDAGSGNLTLTTTGTGNGITLSDNLVAGAAGGAQTIILNSAGTIQQNSGTVTGGMLKGSAVGGVTLNGANQIGTLGDFSNVTGGNFQMTDAHALTVSGTLDNQVGSTMLTATGAGSNLAITGSVKANGQSLATISSGTIDESTGKITAATLTGSSVGGATFTGTNLIGAVNGFTNMTGGGFTLYDGQALDVTGTIDAGSGNLTLKTTSGGITLHANLTAGTASGTQTVALDSAGAIDQVSGKITANTFTGYSTGGATLTQVNDVSQIMGFTNTGSGGFSFTDDPALTVSADINSGTGDLTLTTTGASTNGIILNANLIAGAANGAQTVTLTSAGTIVQTAGTITGGTLTGSSVGGTTLNDANQVASLNGFTNTASGNFSFVDAHALTVSNTLDNSVGNVSLTTSGGGNSLTVDATVNAGANTATFNAAQDFIQNEGTLAANSVNIVAGGNILVGEKAFTDLVAVKDPSTIDQAGSPFFTVSAPFTNHVFIEAQNVSFTAPQRIVMENTGTPPTAPVFTPEGFSLNHNGILPVAITIGGSPQVVDIFGELVQNGLLVDPRSIATTTQVKFAPGTLANNNYRINGCVVHQTGVCTIVSFDFKGFEPAKLAELVLASASGNEDVEEDLTITGAGNDEIWEQQ